MTSKACEKIIDALTQLMEGFAELQESVEEEFNSPKGRTKGDDDDDDDDDEDEAGSEIDAAIVNEMKAAVEALIENEDYSPEEVASVISTMTDALEEIDPKVFEDATSSDDDDDDDYDDDDDDIDYDDDDEDAGDTDDDDD